MRQHPIQDHVGQSIVALCNIPESFFAAVGLRDRRGAPWYDRLLFGAAKRPIAMPAVILLGADGRIVSASGSARLDDGSPSIEIAAHP